MSEKLRRKLVIILVFLLSTMFLASCGDNVEQTELLKYLNEDLVSVAEIENLVTTGYKSVTGRNDSDDVVLCIK